MSEHKTKFDLMKCPFCKDYPELLKSNVDGIIQTKIMCCIVDTGWWIKESDAVELWEERRK